MEERLPRSAGELLSDALGLLRRHFKLLYLLALPFCVVDLLLREAGQSAMQAMGARLTQDPNVDLGAALQALASGAGGFGMMLGSLLVVQLLTTGQVSLASAVWHGRVPALGEAGAAIAARGAALIVTSLLFLITLMALFVVPTVVIGVAMALERIVAVVVGGAACLAVFVFMVMLFLRWGVYTQVVVLEGRFGPRALSRSAELMARRSAPFFESAKVRLSLLFLIVFAISATLQSLFTVPRLVLALFNGWDFSSGMPPLASMDLWFIVSFGLLETATNALLAPFGAVLFTLFYFDLRVRYEALDLEPAAS